MALIMLKLGVWVAMLLPGLGCLHPDDAGTIFGVLSSAKHPRVWVLFLGWTGPPSQHRWLHGYFGQAV